ncbi:5'-nucleotidase/2',3'-cyclic-nucleotide 2'-phosphodiesterase/3'-nucleotidase/5'-nucleotidase [Robertmurraya andreesenii]|uniref:5'-nucleotidase/2',3'-cyclic-nucleotide 2'-phosphodiesterase/3'-nucleotidase/5'-nucleotidase n=2 Tax=Anoxybacillus andreesenii TaxID=1325932 RepID=A0ABT9V7M4_9BACL|nr:5'-nucleotidase C-terminal domain-containing protein [Robertmurraya andreesenii]MDQ0156950.1 5'-nucleotidase/2',3'-cyclic-nucleotide 2'-phosphodiesterase/3'-nucleotidase/5'-nucleotidase [Robertmurraya andreesenii]
MLRIFTAIVCTLMIVAGTVTPHGTAATPDKLSRNHQPFELNIMHFNDTHSHLDNVAKRVTAVKEFRKKKPDALLLDAGDVFSGTLYFNEFHGKADLEFMNLMRFDAMTFGNHDFDLGSTPNGHQALVEFIKGATFPFVSSNVDFSKDEKFAGLFTEKISAHPRNGHIYAGIVKNVKGERIGIFGLTTAETKVISSPGKITFSNYIEEAKRMVAEFQKRGINKIIALSHLGFDDNPAVDNDLELAKAVEGIDIIVGGHSHTALAKPVLIHEKAEPTVIVQAGQYGEYMGTLNVTFDENGVIVKQDGKLIPIAKQAADPEAAKLLKKYSDKISKVRNTPLGATAEEFLDNPRTLGDHSKPSVRKNETPLGNVITDGMLAKAKQYSPDVIMALHNGGGIRAPINKGEITVGEVIEALPFGFTLATMKITGAELKQAFERSLESYPREDSGFLHVSGAKVKFDSSKPAGKRVISIQYFDGEKYVPIQDDKTYTVATNTFTAKGGDGFDVFRKIYKEGRITDLGLSDWEILAEHLKKLGKVHPKVEGRIVDVAD